MSLIAAVSQVIIALGIVNVWVLRRSRPTPFRPAGANSLAEEFERYGLPSWARIAVGSTKLGLAGLLVVGLVVPAVTLPAAALMAVFMTGAIAAHVRVRDPLVKAAPALTMLVLSAVVIVGQVA